MVVMLFGCRQLSYNKSYLSAFNVVNFYKFNLQSWMSLRPPYALQRILHFDGFLKVVKWTKWQIEHLSLLYLLFFCEVQGNDFVCGLLERGERSFICVWCYISKGWWYLYFSPFSKGSSCFVTSRFWIVFVASDGRCGFTLLINRYLLFCTRLAPCLPFSAF